MQIHENSSRNRVKTSVADPDPGWVKITIRIRVEPVIFPRAKKQFFGLKYLNSLMQIRDGKNSDPGWQKFGFGINIPDPQNWLILLRAYRYFAAEVR